MWENTLEKLKILNYETKFCLNGKRQPFNRIHFVMPMKNTSTQFDDFIDICVWLCQGECSFHPLYMHNVTRILA